MVYVYPGCYGGMSLMVFVIIAAMHTDDDSLYPALPTTLLVYLGIQYWSTVYYKFKKQAQNNGWSKNGRNRKIGRIYSEKQNL